jgi:hypothetical protein
MLVFGDGRLFKWCVLASGDYPPQEYVPTDEVVRQHHQPAASQGHPPLSHPFTKSFVRWGDLAISVQLDRPVLFSTSALSLLDLCFQ